MMINAPAKNLETSKELKVKLPLRLYLRLHAIKVLTGKQLSVTIEEALQQHFQDDGSTAQLVALAQARAPGEIQG